ncbi:hypothetical protein OKW96_19980 [Sphingobacterium sp. KU25419]|nr:hypothetical protein OKW96_19980 [Sphingobacterium sp. KU25419]
MTIIISIIMIIGTLILVLLFGKIILRFKFNKQIKILYENSENISDQRYDSSTLNDLPTPVQRYFKLVLKDRQPYISSVRLEHRGLFKTDLKKGFIKITGEQYFSVRKPQFIWKGATMLFTAIDSYINNEGSLKVFLLNLYKVVDAKGSTMDEGELQRWMAESVWFPTNLLPSEMVKWTAIDTNSAKLSFVYKEISFYFIVSFNAVGEITTMQTQRYMTDKKRVSWLCKMSNYKGINDTRIPFRQKLCGDYLQVIAVMQSLKFKR